MHAFMRELIEEVLQEQELNEYVGMKVEMFAKWGEIFHKLYKADQVGKLDSLHNSLQSKLTGASREAVDYFYKFLQDNKGAISEESAGLWANIRAKQARGEKPAHPNSKAYKDAVKSAKDINEGATCCGRCGRVHKMKKDGGEGCKKPYLSKSSSEHCMN